MLQGSTAAGERVERLEDVEIYCVGIRVYTQADFLISEEEEEEIDLCLENKLSRSTRVTEEGIAGGSEDSHRTQYKICAPIREC